MKRIILWIQKNEALILILCAVAVLRIPSLFEPNRYADEDIYLTIGRALRRGLILYRDIYDNKTPLIYAVAALAGNLMWLRFILMVWNLVNVYLIYRLAEKLVANKWGVVGATLLFGIFSTIPLLEGEIANGEIFMIMPVTAAVYLLFTRTGQIAQEARRFFWSGILWSVAFLFKVPVGVELFGLIFYLVFFRSNTIRGLWHNLIDKKLWSMVAGFLVPILVSVGYFISLGALGTYVRSALLQNFGYLSAWGGGASLLGGGLATRAIVLMAALVIIWILKKKLDHKFSFICVWFLMSLFGAFLPGRPYPHYLLEVVGPGSILLAWIFTATFSVYSWIVGIGLFSLLASGIFKYNFWYYKSLPYYQNFVAYISGRESREQYFGFWGRDIIANYQAAALIRKITNADDRIFVWGTEPALYVLSNRLPVVKYTVAYHIFDFGAQDQVGDALARTLPRVIVVMESEKSFSQMAGLLSSNYALVSTLDNMKIYLRLK